MRITILNRAGGGSLAGGLKVITDYAEALQRSGHEVLLVSPRREVRRFRGPLGRRLPFKKRAPIRDDFLVDRTFASSVLETNRPIEARDVPDADIVIASWYECVEWMNALPPEKGRKVHFVQGHEAFDHLPTDRVRAAFASDIPKICVASWLADLVADRYGATDVYTVPNGVDTNHFAQGSRRAPDPAAFGFVYTTNPCKRAELVLSALRDRAARGVGDRIVGFGRGALPEASADLVADYRQAPDQAAIPQIYSACTAWLFTSEEEGFGLPILEAMAAGTPVIATRAGAAPDLIDGTNGMLIDGTAEALSAAMDQFGAMTPDAWDAASRAAKATAAAHTLEKAAARFEAALQQIARR